MKRLVLTLAAIAALGSVSAIATEASAQPRHNDGGYDRHDNDRRGDNRGYDNRRGNDSRGYDNRRGNDDRGYGNRGYDNRRGNDNWDRNRHNGYYMNQRFYYGQPPVAYYGNPGYRPGYQRWARGQYLPNSYWGSNYVVYDYNRYNLRAPPRGYRWYNVNGDYLLAAIAGGLIAEALIH
jgi:Ni/Co efflux regulator RcnB